MNTRINHNLTAIAQRYALLQANPELAALSDLSNAEMQAFRHAVSQINTDIAALMMCLSRLDRDTGNIHRADTQAATRALHQAFMAVESIEQAVCDACSAVSGH
jgi:hypothetical protein